MNYSETTDHLNKLNENHSHSETVDQNVEVTVRIVGPELPPPREFILRQSLTHRSISWIRNCCNSSDLSESNESYPGEAPPSYSSIYPRSRRNYNDVHLSFLPLDSRSSFEAYTPPPSYAQSQGICMDTISVNGLISLSSSSERFLSSQPTFVICPRCTTYTLTIVEINRSLFAHLTAILLLLSGCCCLIPYCLNSHQTVHHYCSICRTYIGTYTP